MVGAVSEALSACEPPPAKAEVLIDARLLPAAEDDDWLIRTTVVLAFADAVDYPAGTGPRALAIGDFNGDGKPDLAVANAGSGDVSVLLGKGDGTFQDATTYATGTNPFNLVAADFNNDGKLDIASGSNSVTTLDVFLNSSM